MGGAWKNTETTVLIPFFPSPVIRGQEACEGAVGSPPLGVLGVVAGSVQCPVEGAVGRAGHPCTRVFLGAENATVKCLEPYEMYANNHSNI